MLTPEKINELSNRKGVRSIAVQNFLTSLNGLTYQEAIGNLEIDRRLYGWNIITFSAIREGINIAYKK